MPIEIKEYVDFKYSRLINNGVALRESVAAATAIPQQMIAPNSLMVEIEGIHSGVLTINCTEYSENCLKKSIPYWTDPYERAVIMYHKDEDGQIIGRVKKAEMIDSKRSNTPAINFTCNIGDEEGIKGIKNGTLSTVSIGAIAYDVRCSICGANVAEEECGHEKGHVYDGKLCYWIIEDMEPREISYVILPSDKYAQTMKVRVAGKKDLKESVEVNKKMSVCDEIMKSLLDGMDSEPGLPVQESAKDSDESVPKSQDKKPEEREPEKKPEPEDDEGEPKEQKPEPEGEPEGEGEKPEEDDSKPEDDKDDSKEDDKNQEKNDSDDNKGEEESNKDDRDAIIDGLKQELADVKKELEDIKKQLKDTKELKEAVELELAGFKVQEKVNVAAKIKDLKESIGIKCVEADQMAKDNSLDELNLIYKTLKETCSYTKLPGKLVQESYVDEGSDNIAQSGKVIKEAVNSNNNKNDFDELEKIHKRLFK